VRGALRNQFGLQRVERTERGVDRSGQRAFGRLRGGAQAVPVEPVVPGLRAVVEQALVGAGDRGGDDVFQALVGKVGAFVR